MRRRRRRPPLPTSITMPRFRRGRIAAFGVLMTLIIVSIVCRSTHTPTATTIPPAATANARPDFARYHDQTFHVARIVDGDTLHIDAPDGNKKTTVIRLWGVDTPEHARAGKPDAHFAREATAFAERTLAGRDVHIVLSPKRTRGKYGRLLAYVFLERGGLMFNEMLLEEGYAYADLRFPHHYADQFKAADKRARKAGIGLWQDVTLEMMPGWKQRFEKRKKR